MKTTMKITLRAFPVKIQDTRTGKTTEDKIILTKEQLQQCMNPERYTGRSKEQVEDFLAEVINPILAKNKEDLGMTAEINV